MRISTQILKVLAGCAAWLWKFKLAFGSTDFRLAPTVLNTLVVAMQVQVAAVQRKFMEELFVYQCIHHVFTIFFALESGTYICTRLCLLLS